MESPESFGCAGPAEQADSNEDSIYSNAVSANLIVMKSPSDSRAPLPDPIHPNGSWRTFQFILQILFTVWFRCRVRGLHHIPPTGGGLVLINHQSFLDPLLVQLALSRPMGFLARDGLYRVPFVSWVLRKHYCVPINRQSAGTASIRDCVRRMEHGFLIGVFPEGTRTHDGSVGEFKPGFMALVRRTRVPILPVGIAGAFEAMPKGAWFIRPRGIRVVFGEPLSSDDVEPYRQRGREEDLIALTRQRVVECHQEADAWLRRD